MASKRKQDMYVTEAAAGAVLGGVVGSNRVPEMSNAAVRLKRKSDAWHARTRMEGGLGKTKDGRYLKLNLLNDNDTTVTEEIKRDGKTFYNKTKVKSPRKTAFNAMRDEFDAKKAKAEHPNHVPFPEGRWEKDPATGQKVMRDAAGKLKPAAVGEMRRKAVLAVGIPAAIGATWHGAHNWGKTRDERHKAKQYRLKAKVSKRKDKSDIDGAIAGGLVGGAAYQAPSHMEWIGRKKQAEKIKATVPDADRITEEWKTKYDVHGAQKGDKRWKKAYRNYPKELDVKGWRNARLQSHLYTGKTGMALTGAAGLAGAAVGVPVVRAINRKREIKHVG